MGLFGNRLGGASLVLEAYKRREVWNKGTVIADRDLNVWRYDVHWNVIKFDDYGDQASPYGWQFDHYPIPQALGGTDDISNLRPLHCTANARLGGLLGNAIKKRQL